MSQPRFCHRLSIVAPPPPVPPEAMRIVTRPEVNRPPPAQGQFHAVPCQGALCSLWLGDPRTGGCGDVIQAVALNGIATGMAQFIAAAEVIKKALAVKNGEGEAPPIPQ